MKKGLFHVEQQRMDYHLHTIHSADGEQSLEELCTAMERQGVQEICLTEHFDLGHPDPELMFIPDWPAYAEDVRQARLRHPGLTIRFGVEMGDIATHRTEAAAVLDRQPLDFRLLSLHVVDGHDCWEPVYYQEKTRDEAYLAYVRATFETLSYWDDFDSLAHLGYVAKFAPYQGDKRPLVYEDAPEEFDAILRLLIRKDKCLEVNTSGLDATGDVFPHTSILRRYIALGGECFTFGSDSHTVARDYQYIERAKDLVRALGGRWQCAFHDRKKICCRI